MRAESAKIFLFASALIIAGSLASSVWGQTRPEPGATPGVDVFNLSNDTVKLSSVFPMAAVSCTNPNLVAIAWRTYGLPVDTGAFREDRIAECHLSISTDGGHSFTDHNMMAVERSYAGGPNEPELSGCNAPWVAIGKDNSIYFGGAMFSSRSVNDPPGSGGKGGRDGVTVSHDNGATWSKLTIAVQLDRWAPGLALPAGRGGAAGPATSAATPWDGANGVVDQQAGTLYAGTREYMAASDDRGANFGTVYGVKGTAAAGFGALVGARSEDALPGEKCPCLVFSVSTDKGKTWTDQVLAQADQWSNSGTVRYPVSAVSPAASGSYAVPAYSPEHRSVTIYYTNDGGKNWKTASPGPIPPNIAVNQVSQVGVGYTSDGRILVTWRGFRNPGAFNTFVAMLQGDKFGPTVKVSPELSIYPPLTYAGNYGNGNGAGDFTTWVTGNNNDAFVAFPYAPGGRGRGHLCRSRTVESSGIADQTTKLMPHGQNIRLRPG